MDFYLSNFFLPRTGPSNRCNSVMGRRSRVDLGQPASVEVDFERGERVDGAEGIACPTWCEFMEDSLHHPEWGYYSAARVVFGESSDAADFTTFPVSMRPAFGAMIADRLHGLWLAAGGGSGPFVVCELGAGTGVLAHDVLTHMADHLPRLYAVVQYVIAERSASLRSLQAATNERFVRESKLRVVCADARDLGGARLRQELQAAAAAHCASGGRKSAASSCRRSPRARAAPCGGCASLRCCTSPTRRRGRGCACAGRGPLERAPRRVWGRARACRRSAAACHRRRGEQRRGSEAGRAPAAAWQSASAAPCVPAA